MLGFDDTPGDVTMRDVTCLQKIPPQRTCHIEQMAVSEKARGKGIGKKLLTWADDTARRKGCTRMILEVISKNAHAKGISEKHGYVTKERPCCEHRCMCPFLCCLISVPYAYTMVKTL
eukprot:TRINITY_DN47138_c0_g1_i1.p2 TRINITY_DN47138_c0_g1~~TRINITY_DN47138_c0_g1_i1.p2  ORF type:complete len:118 (+),score=7.76 TRINITY_DN47138_c0_g1_i1:340-693(+)